MGRRLGNASELRQGDEGAREVHPSIALHGGAHAADLQMQAWGREHSRVGLRTGPGSTSALSGMGHNSGGSAGRGICKSIVGQWCRVRVRESKGAQRTNIDCLDTNCR